MKTAEGAAKAWCLAKGMDPMFHWDGRKTWHDVGLVPITLEEVKAALAEEEDEHRKTEAKLAQAVEALKPFAKFEETLRSWHSDRYDPPWSEDQKEWPRHLPVVRRHRPVDAETSMFAELYRSDFERARSAAAMGEKR